MERLLDVLRLNTALAQNLARMREFMKDSDSEDEEEEDDDDEWD